MRSWWIIPEWLRDLARGGSVIIVSNFWLLSDHASFPNDCLDSARTLTPRLSNRFWFWVSFVSSQACSNVSSWFVEVSSSLRRFVMLSYSWELDAALMTAPCSSKVQLFESLVMPPYSSTKRFSICWRWSSSKRAGECRQTATNNESRKSLSLPRFCFNSLPKTVNRSKLSRRFSIS